MLKVLDKILLSDNVVEDFYKYYQGSEFKNWMISILPEINDCKNTTQDNPWHIYNCLDHILHSVQAINNQTINLESSTRRMLAYTMLLHDIGKPECKIRRYAKAYKREVDSFFNHNIASVKIGNRSLKQLGFTDEEINDILTLVENHDVFINLTLDPTTNPHKKVLTNEVFEDIVSQLNRANANQLMKYLIMVGRADNLAQNPEMTGQSLKLLDVMDDMLQERYSKQNNK